MRANDFQRHMHQQPQQPQESGPQKSAIRNFAENFGIGLVAVGAWGLFKACRAVANVYNQGMHDRGIATPWWFKPNPEPKRDGVSEQLSSLNERVRQIGDNVEKLRNPENLYVKKRL